MSDKKPFYITTTLPYVNAEPHIGFALEIIQADTLARWQRLVGREVFFNTGSDEHGQKIAEAAQKAGQEVKQYVDTYAEKFNELKQALNLSNDKFIRTTDEAHVKAAQALWQKCFAKGDIYEKEFEGLYCVGCEKFLTERDMTDGKCVIHGTEPQLVKEKNWFFKLSRYQKDILDYLSKPESIYPEWRRQEAINFVKEGLEDFSISRDKKRLSWGIPVPGDDTQVMYVWFDALTNYISTLGWPNEGGDFKKFWQEGETIQMAGKDQVRFQSIMWQAMLLSAEVKNTDKIFYHGFINSGGQKMSKSLGNVISPFEMVKRYGTDATRYLLLRHVHPTDDTDVTWERLDEWYEAGLVNGLGNLTSRILKMSETYGVSIRTNNADVVKNLDSAKSHEAINSIWAQVMWMDGFIQKQEPFKKIKTNPDEAKSDVERLLKELLDLANDLAPLMPETSAKILEAIKANKKPENLFPRLEARS